MSEAAWSRVRKTKCWGHVPIFCNDNEAIAWAVLQRAFNTATEAQTAYDAARTLYGREIWARWIGLVGKRLERLERRGEIA